MSSASTTASAHLQADDPLARAEAALSEGRARDAIADLRPIVESGRAGLLARLMYGRALGAAGDATAAIEAGRETALLFPGVAIAASGLGEALLGAGHLPTAIGEFQRALRIDPQLREARYWLGCAWLEAGEPDKALEAFHEIPEDSVPFELPGKIAKADKMRSLPRSNANYVRHLFDQFAVDYDSRMLGQLAYSVPRILRELASLVLPDFGSRTLNILDLGCGTGLAGIEFRDVAQRLDGFDLSPAMIEKARARGIYDQLAVSDIENLPASEEHYDLVLAADTLVYLGDLTVVFEGMSAQLKPDGLFLLTVEKDDGSGFTLGSKRRWRHSEDYLRKEAQHSGFAVAGFLACAPRTEAGVPVDGYAVALQRPA